MTCANRWPAARHRRESDLRVATPDIGGGFGPKLCVYPEDVAVVAAARLLRRPLKWIEDRREHFTDAVQERDQYWSLDIALDAAGQDPRHARAACCTTTAPMR